MPTITTLRVFVNDDGEHGNPVGIFVDQQGEFSEEQRLALTSKTGYSECIFIEDVESGAIRTYTAQQEIPFAGHAAMGAAAFLGHAKGGAVSELVGPEGVITVLTEDDVLWVGTELRTTPPWWHERLSSAADLEALGGPQSESQIHTQLWAWIHEEEGLVRSRTFAPGWGIPEDEANGSGCMRLAAALGRQLKIIHGAGSVIYARPATPGVAQVGGRVVEEAPQELDV